VAVVLAVAPTQLLVASWDVANASPNYVATTKCPGLNILNPSCAAPPPLPPAPQQAPPPPPPPPVHLPPPVLQTPKLDLPPVVQAPKNPVPPIVQKNDIPPVVLTPKLDVPPLVQKPKLDLPPVVQSPKLDVPPLVQTPKLDIPPNVQSPKNDIPALGQPPKLDLPKILQPPKNDIPPGGQTPQNGIPQILPLPQNGKPLIPNAPIITPVQTPQNKTPILTAGKPTLIIPPKGLDAPVQAIQAAKTAPLNVINPVAPPKPPTPINFTEQVQKLAIAPNTKVDTVKVDNKVIINPKHWDYLDYDKYNRPVLYNPLDVPMTFRYYYNGDYREVYVEVGSRIVLDIDIPGVFPFTAVGGDYVTAGNFNGGAWIPPDGWDGPPPETYTPPPPPQQWQNMNVSVPDTPQPVLADKVLFVGHDESRPVGEQDAFMLNDTCMAYGKLQDGRDGGSMQISKVQTLPGVGPETDAREWVNTALQTATDQPADGPDWVMAGGLAVMALAGAVLAGVGTWVIRHPKVGKVAHA
jgi:hypothetical protein